MRSLVKTLLILSLMSVAASLAAAPVGYSINSDSQTSNADSLYKIDLGASPPTEVRIGPVQSGGQIRIDVEGLAFATNGKLYAVDDDALRLFPIDPVTAHIDTSLEVFISGLPIGGKNDFGMTFACDGNLYVTSVIKQSLYLLALNGKTEAIGSTGTSINAIAAWGDPVEIYGLANGADEFGNAITSHLYKFNPMTATFEQVGPLIAAGKYLQAGLAFDDSGQLWAITEGAQFGWPSQVMKIDKNTGAASEVKTLSGEKGFESLAIAVPRGCERNPGNNNPAPVEIEVNKEWFETREGLDIDHEAKIELQCTGLKDGDGQWVAGYMRWKLKFAEGTVAQTATIYPDPDRSSYCRTVEHLSWSAVESISTCGIWTEIPQGADKFVCTVTNTVFFEGIPALNPLGLAVAALLLLLTGLFAARRF